MKSLNSIDKRYTGATDGPISQGQLKSDIGLLADTEASQALMRGDYMYLEDYDKATECTLRKLAHFLFSDLGPCMLGQC